MTTITHNVGISVDYNGNIYLCDGNTFYNILVTHDKSGIELVQMSQALIKSCTNLFDDYSYMKDHLLRGKIVLSDTTLSGRASHVLNRDEGDFFDTEKEKDIYDEYDFSYREGSYFKIDPIKKNHKNDYNDSDDEWDFTNEQYPESHDFEYRFCGVDEKNYDDDTNNNNIDNDCHNIKFSTVIHMIQMLIDTKADHDTLLVRGNNESKVISSCIRRVDGFCTVRLVFYSNSGEIKIQYVGNYDVRVRVQKNNGKLCLLLLSDNK